MNEPEAKAIAEPKLTLAVGKSRFSTHWKNTEVTWPWLVKRLSQTQHTGETLTEYLNMPKSRMDDIKDVGGFVGGTLQQGRRKADSVAWRQIVTLDMDFAPAKFDEIINRTLGGKTYLLYATHKYSPNKPRIRVVFPLARPVTPDEYQAISRRVAADIGINFFDDTTYEPHRLMYWPSTPDDIEYFFKSYSGEWIKPEDVLARYHDWHDQSQWPESSRVYKVLKKQAEKQEDPYSKRGLIGTFCRTYSIEEAMDKFLPGVYVKCDGSEDRYTYSEGSTSGGAIIYEGKFLYSHHATDPCSEQLVNAFDMVRIHKFAGLDDNVNLSTPTGRRPSYLAMLDLARDDEKVKVTTVNETMEAAQQDFEILPDDDDDDASWKAKAHINKNGGFIKDPWNIKLILCHDKNLAKKVVLDRFSHRTILKENLPWHKISDSRWWGNDDDSCLRNYLSDRYGIDGKGVIDDALREVLIRNSVHVVQDYLTSLPAWDGVQRLDSLIIDYLGAEDTELTRQMTRKALVAAVTRAMEPGCKFDYVLTLIGQQGLGKSFIWKRIGRGWTSDSVSTVTGKDAMEQIQGAWIIELAELAALRKAELEAVKQFITKQDDSFRPAYGREVEHYDRQCIFVATTNEPAFIRDATGGRRWWPIQVGVEPRKYSPFEDLTDSVVDQIWAEAMVYYMADEPLYLDSRMEAEARNLQKEHTEESPWAGIIRAYVDHKLPESWKAMNMQERQEYFNPEESFINSEGTETRTRICALEVWVEAMNGAPKAMGRMQANEINNVLRNLDGWEPYQGVKKFGPYGVQRGFFRVTKG